MGPSIFHPAEKGAAVRRVGPFAVRGRFRVATEINGAGLPEPLRHVLAESFGRVRFEPVSDELRERLE